MGSTIISVLCFMQLYNFLGYLMDNFTPTSNERKSTYLYFTISLIFHNYKSILFVQYLSETIVGLPENRNLICHIFRENEVCRDAEWERHFDYKNIEVPEVYSGPHLEFPLTVEQVTQLVDAFRNKRVGAPTVQHLRAT